MTFFQKVCTGITTSHIASNAVTFYMGMKVCSIIGFSLRTLNDDTTSRWSASKALFDSNPLMADRQTMCLAMQLVYGVISSEVHARIQIAGG